MASAGTLRHLAFFEELGSMDEGDPNWRAVSAGLVVMRLVDRWIDENGLSAQKDAFAIGGVRRAIDEIPATTPVRAMLSSVVDAMVAVRAAEVHAISPKLMAYGQLLEYEGRWSLAADIYRTIIQHSDPIAESDSVVPANLRLAISLRTLGDIEGAAESYAAAGTVAGKVGDMIGVLRARIGDAKIAMLRGNLPRAEAILDDTIAAAAERGLSDVESMALNDRAATAGLRGDHETAIRLAYRALQKSEAEKDLVLHDIATAFYKLGVRSAARDAYLILAATAQNQYTRWASTIALLEIAAEDGMAIVFERYHRELSAASLPPVLKVDFEYASGRAYMRLGMYAESRSWLTKASETAGAHELHQFSFDIQRELELLDETREHEPLVNYREAPTTLTDVAEAIRAMRGELEPV
jgi:tetratricopeptide (TPR) repeat protein